MHLEASARHHVLLVHLCMVSWREQECEFEEEKKQQQQNSVCLDAFFSNSLLYIYPS